MKTGDGGQGPGASEKTRAFTGPRPPTPDPKIFGENFMKAIAVTPGKPDSVHLAEMPRPSVEEIPNGRGVLVLSSVTGGDRKVEVEADKINLEFVLGNKVMVGTVNANREYFETGVKDMAEAEAEYTGWLARLLTHPVKGLDNYQELFDKLTNAKGAIKVFCEVGDFLN